MKFINTFILVLILNILTAVTINIPADYSTIQEGINAANDGDIVIVSQGTYFENLTINKEITLKSNIVINEFYKNLRYDKGRYQEFREVINAAAKFYESTVILEQI